MDKLKFVLVSIVTLTLLGLLGYWSVTTIQSGSDHVSDQKIKQLEKENKDLKIEVETQKSQIGTLESRLAELTPVVEEEPEVIVYKYQDLINELQKLISDNVVLKLKSRGTRVGTIQNFLNIYNNTSNKVDNDYGVGTVKSVTAFQKDMGLTANGEVGKDTLNKMITWLKNK